MFNSFENIKYDAVFTALFIFHRRVCYCSLLFVPFRYCSLLFVTVRHCSSLSKMWLLTVCRLLDASAFQRSHCNATSCSIYWLSFGGDVWLPKYRGQAVSLSDDVRYPNNVIFPLLTRGWKICYSVIVI